MKEHPLIFTPDNAAKIADDRKTMTRRVLKEQPPDEFPGLIKMDDGSGWFWYSGIGSGKRTWPCEYRVVLGKPVGELVGDLFNPPLTVGSIMWVRESFLDDGTGEPGNIHYRGAANEADLKWIAEEGWKWKPSIHMPRWACRSERIISLVRIERLRDIPTDDIRREGVDNGYTNPTMGIRHVNEQRMAFQELWQSIHGTTGPKSWSANPWVAVYGW